MMDHERPARSDPDGRMSQRASWLHNPWLQLGLVLLVAGAFRLWQIERIPPGLFGDEATEGLDALDVLAGRGAIFFPANYGREGLHVWIVAAAFRLLGALHGRAFLIDPLALRLPSALAGILTTAATYWLGRELVQAWRNGSPVRASEADGGLIDRLIDLVPLVASLYVATSFWHIHFSRFGIRGIFTPLCGALAFAAFWHAVNLRAGVISPGQAPEQAGGREASPRLGTWPRALGWYALSGLFFGLALHFYTASRFYPLFLGGFLLLQAGAAFLTGRKESAILRRDFLGVLLLFAMTALVFAPLGLYFLQHPGSFTQRAGEVAVFGGTRPLARMAQAAVANVRQFFIPGSGDTAQFYNLPGRAVFDVVTALLALTGIAVLLRRWRQPAALFLLAWWPALMLPSFLATDRAPTLPRVLGVIPGVYFFPAVGIVAVAAIIASRGEKAPSRTTPSHVHIRSALVLSFVVILVALTLHAWLSYRDYFRQWGSSQATFDAFEGDMAAAWRWLGTDPPAGHVFLSSDIYRHPTFMLLGEHATVRTYFQLEDSGLSWFDAREALPLPPPGQPATYLLASSSPPFAAAAGFLASQGYERGRVIAPEGTPALTVVELPADAPLPQATLAPIPFTDQLALVGAAWGQGQDGRPELNLTWRTDGRAASDWRGYRLELATGDGISPSWRATLPFESFRGPEWLPGGSFLTRHRPELPDGAKHPRQLRIRLLQGQDGQPITRPEAPEGWHDIQF